jgi:hypothetical protein
MRLPECAILLTPVQFRKILPTRSQTLDSNRLYFWQLSDSFPQALKIMMNIDLMAFLVGMPGEQLWQFSRHPGVREF